MTGGRSQLNLVLISPARGTSLLLRPITTSNYVTTRPLRTSHKCDYASASPTPLPPPSPDTVLHSNPRHSVESSFSTTSALTLTLLARLSSLSHHINITIAPASNPPPAASPPPPALPVPQRHFSRMPHLRSTPSLRLPAAPPWPSYAFPAP